MKFSDDNSLIKQMKADCEFIKNILKNKKIEYDNEGNDEEDSKVGDTLILQKTKFEMRANLPEKELNTLSFWRDIDLWKSLRNASKGRKKFILHDGPPYANGPIHMGTAANKILKDIINRSMQIEGFDAEYVPGWDCHGLPIEWQIEKEYRKKGLNKDEVKIEDFEESVENLHLNG